MVFHGDYMPSLIRIGLLLGVLSLGAVMGDEPVKTDSKPRPPVVLTEEGRRVHLENFVFDGHNDLPWEMRTKADSSFDKRDIRQAQTKMHTDIPRLRTGGVKAQFWSVYVPSET